MLSNQESEFLQIQPKSLQFDHNSIIQEQFKIQIDNNQQHHVYFQLLSTNSKLISFEKNFANIDSYESSEVQIYLHPKQFFLHERIILVAIIEDQEQLSEDQRNQYISRDFKNLFENTPIENLGVFYLDVFNNNQTEFQIVNPSKTIKIGHGEKISQQITSYLKEFGNFSIKQSQNQENYVQYEDTPQNFKPHLQIFDNLNSSSYKFKKTQLVTFSYHYTDQDKNNYENFNQIITTFTGDEDFPYQQQQQYTTDSFNPQIFEKNEQVDFFIAQLQQKETSPINNDDDNNNNNKNIQKVIQADLDNNTDKMIIQDANNQNNLSQSQQNKIYNQEDNFSLQNSNQKNINNSLQNQLIQSPNTETQKNNQLNQNPWETGNNFAIDQQQHQSSRKEQIANLSHQFTFQDEFEQEDNKQQQKQIQDKPPQQIQQQQQQFLNTGTTNNNNNNGQEVRDEWDLNKITQPTNNQKQNVNINEELAIYENQFQKVLNFKQEFEDQFDSQQVSQSSQNQNQSNQNQNKFQQNFQNKEQKDLLDTQEQQIKQKQLSNQQNNNQQQQQQQQQQVTNYNQQQIQQQDQKQNQNQKQILKISKIVQKQEEQKKGDGDNSSNSGDEQHDAAQESYQNRLNSLTVTSVQDINFNLFASEKLESSQFIEEELKKQHKQNMIKINKSKVIQTQISNDIVFLALSKDLEYLILVDNQNIITVYSIKNNQKAIEYTDFKNNKRKQVTVLKTFYNKFLIATSDKMLRVYSLDNFKLEASFQVTRKIVYAVSFEFNKQFLAAGGLNLSNLDYFGKKTKRRNIYVYHIITYKLLFKLQLPKTDKIVTQLEFANEWQQDQFSSLLGIIVSNDVSSTLILMKINTANKNKAEMILNNDMSTIGINLVNNLIFCSNLNKFTCLEKKQQDDVNLFYHIGIDVKDSQLDCEKIRLLKQGNIFTCRQLSAPNKLVLGVNNKRIIIFDTETREVIGQSSKFKDASNILTCEKNQVIVNIPQFKGMFEIYEIFV